MNAANTIAARLIVGTLLTVVPATQAKAIIHGAPLGCIPDHTYRLSNETVKDLASLGARVEYNPQGYFTLIQPSEAMDRYGPQLRAWQRAIRREGIDNVYGHVDSQYNAQGTIDVHVRLVKCEFRAGV